MLTLEFPPVLRAGDADVVRLTLEVDSQGNLTPTAEINGNTTTGEVIVIPNLYETHNVLAEARLDMAGMEVSPAGIVSETLLPGQKLLFYWSIRSGEVGKSRGTVWFYLRFGQKDGSPESRQALSAQVIEIETQTFFGLGQMRRECWAWRVLRWGLWSVCPFLRMSLNGYGSGGEKLTKREQDAGRLPRFFLPISCDICHNLSL